MLYISLIMPRDSCRISYILVIIGLTIILCLLYDDECNSSNFDITFNKIMLLYKRTLISSTIKQKIMEVNNEKNDFKSIENNRWMANHIIEILHGYQNGLSSNKEIIERTSKDLLLKLEKVPNTLLSIVITAITLIVGLSSLDPIEEMISHISVWLLIGSILVGLVLAALIIYLYKNWKIRNISRKLVNIEKEYYDGYTTQNFLNGFFNRYVKESTKLDETQLQLLDCFFLIVQGAIIYNIFNKSTKELNDYHNLYDEFKPTKYSENLYFLIMDYAYDLVKNLKFCSNNLVSYDNIKKIFTDIDRENLFDNIWEHKIKDFIENYEQFREYKT